MRFPVALAVLLVMTAAIFAPSLGFPLVYEDTRDAPMLLDDARTRMQLEANPFRSLTVLSHWVTRQVFGIQAWAFHLGSLLLHLVNVSLVLALAWLVLPPWGAVVAAGVFAWHPVQVEAVTYVSSRSELAATAGLLLALLAASLGSVAGAVVGVVLACLGKETAVVAFALVPLWAWWTRAAFPVTRFLVVAGVGASVAVALISSRIDAVTMAPSLTLAGEQLAVMWRLVSFVALPWPLTVDPDWSGVLPWGAVALVMTAGLVAWCLTEGAAMRSWWTLAVLWTLVAWSPRLVVPLYEGLHVHHLYNAMFVWGIVIAAWLRPRTGVHHG